MIRPTTAHINLDAIRSIAGEPEGVYCRAVSHPELPRLRDTRSSIILDYGERIRCSLVLNHTHRAGPRYRESLLLVEGTLGAARSHCDPHTLRRGMARGTASRIVVHRGLRRAHVESSARGRR